MYKTFRDMPVWQESMRIAEQIFGITDKLPRKEDYGFTSQVRRSALSISANLAEGFGRNHSADKAHFYYIARGSLTETQSHIEYGKRVGYIEPAMAEELDHRLTNLHSALNKLIASIKKVAS